jgi:hypothetical protein
MKILLEDSNAKLSRENLFKLAIWNESLRGISNDNRFSVLKFPVSKF